MFDHSPLDPVLCALFCGVVGFVLWLCVAGLAVLFAPRNVRRG